VFAAMIAPPSNTQIWSFTIPWSPAHPNPLTCFREPGQGEYDNIHITPYLGFDDPKTDDPSAPTAVSKFPWIEAPLAADEVIHLHWRWGTPTPDEAINNHTPPEGFRGWEDLPTNPKSPPPRANKIDGAPLIPPNHSLRIKIARSDVVGDNTNDPSTPPAAMTKDAVTVWYMPIAHQPTIGTPSQFFGQGFGLALHLEKLTSLIANEEKFELLTHKFPKPNYHNFRWTSSGQQRIPNGEPALSQNMLSIPGAPSNPSVTPSTPP
jgi:hypothetical protein